MSKHDSSIKIPKQIDSVGRVTIPAIIRQMLHINIGDFVTVEMFEGRIVIMPNTQSKEIDKNGTN